MPVLSLELQVKGQQVAVGTHAAGGIEQWELGGVGDVAGKLEEMLQTGGRRDSHEPAGRELCGTLHLPVLLLDSYEKMVSCEQQPHITLSR